MGLSGPGRLHDLCVTLDAASPGEIKAGGAGWTIVAGFAESPFGTCLIGQSERGICHLSFVPDVNSVAAEETIHADWPHAEIRWDDALATRIAASVFHRESGSVPRAPLKAVVCGSAFQVRVCALCCRSPAEH